MISSIIFDWKRTLYDPDTKTLIKGALDLLEYLKNKNIPMVLIGKGKEDMNEEVKKLGVKKYFTEIIFAEGAKDPKLFAKYVPSNPKETVFVGDRVRSELEIGNKLGATTIWVRQGKFAKEQPEVAQQQPDYSVLSLSECLSLLKEIW